MHAPRRSIRKLATYATLALVFAACAKKSTGSAGEAAPVMTDQPVLAGKADGNEATKNDKLSFDQRPREGGRKIIRTGRLDLVIEDYDATRDKLEAILKAAGGYVDSTQVAHHKGAVGE